MEDIMPRTYDIDELNYTIINLLLSDMNYIWRFSCNNNLHIRTAENIDNLQCQSRARISKKQGFDLTFATKENGSKKVSQWFKKERILELLIFQVLNQV